MDKWWGGDAAKTVPAVQSANLVSPVRKGDATRERILEVAEASVLAKGFAATSLEEIFAEAEITKSGFFYHFRDKGDLARAILVRYIEANDKLFQGVFERGDQLSDDPLQSCLIGLRLLAEEIDSWPDGHPGCLLASICYQERLFDRDVRMLTAQTAERWSGLFAERVARIAGRYAAKDRVDAEQLGRMVVSVLNGAIIMSKLLTQPHVIVEQVMLVHSYIKLLYTPTLPPQIARPANDAEIVWGARPW